MTALFDLLATLTWVGIAWLIWHFWGEAAKRAGTGRLQVLAAVLALGWLLG